MGLLHRPRPVARAASPEPEPGPAPDGTLSPIEVYTVWGRELAWVAAGDERTSDWLNRADAIAVQGVRDLPLGGDAPPPAQVTPGPDADPPVVERLAADILFVVPPVLPPKRHLRLHRRIVALRLELASFRLVGRVHIRPGAEAGDYLLRGNRRFVPITGVELTYTGEPAFARHLPVAIVNVTHVTLLDRGTSGDAAQLGTDEAQPAVEPTTEEPTSDPMDAPSAATPDTFLSVRTALEQLSALADDGLISRAEQRRKRAEILSRL